MKNYKKNTLIQALLLIIITGLLSSYPSNSTLANAIPVEKNVQKRTHSKLNKQKRSTKKNHTKPSISTTKTTKTQQKQSYYGLQGIMIFMLIVILVFIAALVFFIVGLVLNNPVMWIPALILISIPIVVFLIFFLSNVILKAKKKKSVEDIKQ